MVDTSSQRLAHRVGLVLLAVLSGLGAATIRRPAAHARQVTGLIRTTHEFFKMWSGVFLAVGAALVILLNLPNTVYPGPQRQGLQVKLLLLSTFLTVLGLLWAQRRETPPLAIRETPAAIAAAGSSSLPTPAPPPQPRSGRSIESSLNSCVNLRRDNLMFGSPIRWELSLSWLSQNWGQAHFAS
jgi:hypothetical protein